MQNLKQKRRSPDGSVKKKVLSQVLLKTLNSVTTCNAEFQRLAGFIRSGRWDLAYRWSESVSAAAYDTALEHFESNQMAALIKKLPLHWRDDFKFDRDPTSTALDKFDAAEERCRKTNRRLLAKGNSPYSHSLERARKWIARVLGDEPDLRSIYDKCSLTAGAAIGVHGNATNVWRKLSALRWTVSPSAAPYALAALRTNWSVMSCVFPQREGMFCIDWEVGSEKLREKLEFVEFNKLDFVPKTAKTDRSIAVEPLLNSYVQSGIDAELRARLKRWGYDLSNQEYNSELARRGSITGELATLDLSSASDTVSKELVKLLLPPAWWRLLNATRSPAYRDPRDGSVRTYHKFASMGNGFCFPLETLIFASLVRASVEEAKDLGVAPRSSHLHAVYGDDIILTVDAARRLIRLLSFAGFSTNVDKTFLEGPFRESCGADWYLGQDVRPVYLDFHLDATANKMVFHNSTLRGAMTSRLFEDVRVWLRENTPAHHRFLRPETYHLEPSTGASLFERRYVNGAFTVPQDVFMGCSFARWSIAEQRWRHRAFVYSPVTDEDTGDRDRRFPYDQCQYFSSLISPQGGGQLNLRRKVVRHAVLV
ncbi:TPA_asm: RNA-directed RNA polymerase [ssRNA phage SRR6255733_3]|uniref:RNA-directed RNA polymerase n=1 Tax=ssRNA phage SRR6255733_3 TaxID=2786499 RepID=A0A8S5L0J6_9VIRU|nr:RNA-directed RNA polymerase [ssRNA phage SRR6255733_3]DAD50951.1 TPA_asm: RNA-directed RNA polymerase [ssRNA phage SRR6255733_3]